MRIYPSIHTPQRTRLCGVLLLTGLELLLVELELLALKDVAVSTSRLAWAGGDDGEKTTSTEGLVKVRVDLGVLLALGEDTLDVVGLLGCLLGGGGVGRLGGDDLLGVVGLVPCDEGVGVNLDDARLDKSLGTEELVVGGVVFLQG